MSFPFPDPFALGNQATNFRARWGQHSSLVASVCCMYASKPFLKSPRSLPVRLDIYGASTNSWKLLSRAFRPKGSSRRCALPCKPMAKTIWAWSKSFQ